MRLLSGILLVCGILSIIYGIVIFAVQSGSMFFAVWFAMGCAFLVLAVLAFTGVASAVPVPVRFLILVIVIAGLTVFGYFEARIASCFGMEADDGMEYIVVLGAQVKESGPSVVLKYRLDAACEYLERNPATLCIVTGSQGANEPCTEARGMAEYLISRGIDESRIILEEKADNTVQNLTYSRELIGRDDARTAIVTNNFHLFRAMHIAAALGYKEVQGIAADSTPLYLPNNMFREFLGVLKDWLKGDLVLTG